MYVGRLTSEPCLVLKHHVGWGSWYMHALPKICHWGTFPRLLFHGPCLNLWKGPPNGIFWDAHACTSCSPLQHHTACQSRGMMSIYVGICIPSFSTTIHSRVAATIKLCHFTTATIKKARGINQQKDKMSKHVKERN